MKEWVNKPYISRVVARNILPANSTRIPAGKKIKLQGILGDTLNVAVNEGEPNKVIDVDGITASGSDLYLLEFPADSEEIKTLARDKGLYHAVLRGVLSEGYELLSPDEFLLMSVFDRRHGNLILGHPKEFALSIDRQRYREIAKDMMLRLASSHQGAEILGAREVKDYRHSFAKAKDGGAADGNYAMLWRIVANADFSDDDIAEIVAVAKKTENYEFLSALQDAYKQTRQAASISR
ncbi:MAG: hypothetical protein SFW63_01135 [Alphaproteobacteria bacterium]|nr:hypothetical protein [Alphaproteobacteria bacterium]